MERTRRYLSNKQPNAILCADMHLRETKPRARTDDYFPAQWEKVQFIKALQHKYECAVLHAGDLYDYWKPSPELTANTFRLIPNLFCTVYGQHDLPNHNLKLAHKSGLKPLWEVGFVDILEMCHYGQVPDGKQISMVIMNKKILIWHTLTYKDERPFPDHKGPSAMRLLKKYPDFDLIVTGDNHIPFVQEYEGRLLVNPGSMMRMTAAQIDHKPRVYLWYADSNTVEPVYLPIQEGVVTREHIDVKERREKRIDAFISKLKMDWEETWGYSMTSDGGGFENNLKAFFNANKTEQDIQDIIYKAIDHESN
jgi:predicted phosphodiesterase